VHLTFLALFHIISAADTWLIQYSTNVHLVETRALIANNQLTTTTTRQSTTSTTTRQPTTSTTTRQPTTSTTTRQPTTSTTTRQPTTSTTTTTTTVQLQAINITAFSAIVSQIPKMLQMGNEI
jgi:hypothetical protein